MPRDVPLRPPTNTCGEAFCKKSGQGVVPIENAATVSEAVAALKVPLKRENWI